MIESNKKNHDKGQDSARDDFKQKPESRRIIPPKPTAKQRLENFLASAAAVGLAKIRAPFRFIRDTLHWLFPSKQVKEQIQDLEQMKPMFDHDLYIGSAYRYIKSCVRAKLIDNPEIVQKAREHESWHSARAYNLNMIVHEAFDDVAYGGWYLYRGVLMPQGKGMKAVCIKAAQELITMGVWDPDSMRRLRSSLKEAIANAG